MGKFSSVSLSIIGKLVDDSSTVKMRMNHSLITKRCCGNQQDEEGNKRLGSDGEKIPK